MHAASGATATALVEGNAAGINLESEGGGGGGVEVRCVRSARVGRGPESRRAADTAAEASCRSRASGSGARGFDADSWGAGYGGDVGRADRYAGD
jgi:hypothetical protein